MKLTFSHATKQNWSKLQVELSDAIMKYLAVGKDFEVSFDLIKESKTNKQLRGIYRLIRLFALRLIEKQGNFISEDTAKELFKY